MLGLCWFSCIIQALPGCPFPFQGVRGNGTAPGRAQSLPEHPAGAEQAVPWGPFPNFSNRRSSLRGLQRKPPTSPCYKQHVHSLCSQEGRCSPELGSEGRGCQTYPGSITLWKQAVNLVISTPP